MLHSVAVDVFITDSTWRNLRSFSSTSFEVRLVENRDAKKTGVCMCVCVQPTFVSWQECSVHVTSAARVSFVFTCVAGEFLLSCVLHVD